MEFCMSVTKQIAILRSVEELILLALFRVLLLLIAQSDKAVRLAPTFRLIPEFALLIGVRGARASSQRFATVPANVPSYALR